MPRSTRKSKPKASRSSAVPGSLRGFSLQASRFLQYLLTVPEDSIVCLEHLDDVSVIAPGTALVEQDKSYLSRNSLSDRSTALWKTFANWVSLVRTSQLDLDNTRFVLCAPGSNPGKLCRLLRDAQDDSAADNAIDALETHSKQKSSSDWLEHLKQILECPRHELRRLIVSFSCEHTKTCSEKALRAHLRSKLVSEEVLDDALAWAHGWVKTSTDRQLARGDCPKIRQSDFHLALLGFVKTHDRLVILRSFAGTPAPEDVDSELSLRCYVRQLRLIDVDDVELLSAVNDFLKASIDRTEWAVRGFVDATAYDEYQEELTGMWRHEKSKNGMLYKHLAEEERGRLLYSECISRSLPLGGLTAPPAFLRGSLHSLADDQSVGWHPEYETALATQEANS